MRTGHLAPDYPVLAGFLVSSLFGLLVNPIDIGHSLATVVGSILAISNPIQLQERCVWVLVAPPTLEPNKYALIVQSRIQEHKTLITIQVLHSSLTLQAWLSIKCPPRVTRNKATVNNTERNQCYSIHIFYASKWRRHEDTYTYLFYNLRKKKFNTTWTRVL